MAYAASGGPDSGIRDLALLTDELANFVPLVCQASTEVERPGFDLTWPLANASIGWTRRPRLALNAEQLAAVHECAEEAHRRIDDAKPTG